MDQNYFASSRTTETEGGGDKAQIIICDILTRNFYCENYSGKAFLNPIRKLEVAASLF